MTTKKGHNMTICLISIQKDCFGVHDVSITINTKPYTYPIVSEYAVRQFERQLKLKRPGRALAILNRNKVEGFNGYIPDNTKV